METARKKYTVTTTRNGEYERYYSDIKVLFVSHDGKFWRYLGQHEQAPALERMAKRRLEVMDYTSLRFQIKTGTGILVEFGTIKERTLNNG